MLPAPTSLIPAKSQSSLEEIKAALGDAFDEFEPFHNQILVGIYMRPERTTGGIIRPQSNVDEDKWQGKVGVVLKIGPMAFVDDARTAFMDQDVEIGDWIVYRTSDGFSIDINKVHCRLIEDVQVKGRVPSPEIIW